MNKIVINQNKDKFYNSDAILFVNIDSGGITLHTRNAEIDFGRYEHDTRKRKLLKCFKIFFLDALQCRRKRNLNILTIFPTRARSAVVKTKSRRKHI